jgi:hypothetical protein
MIDTKNDIVDNIDTNIDTVDYVQQFKHKIFKRIPSDWKLIILCSEHLFTLRIF